MIKKLRFFIPLALVILFLLFAGIFAITQEWTDIDSDESDDEDFELVDMEEYYADPLPEWIPPGPPRWFRSNAGGMTLEETPSRLAALRNKYALVIDYVPPNEADARLMSFYQSDYTVEIRILYEKAKPSRRQWLFRDEAGIVRLNAVFRPPSDELSDELSEEELFNDSEVFSEEADIENDFIEDDFTENDFNEEFAALDESDETPELAQYRPDEDSSESEVPPAAVSNSDEPASTGFIEIFNEKTQIIEEVRLYEDDSEIRIFYFYNNNILVRAEAEKMDSDLSLTRMYTDSYRYNRSYSLRHVERLYHEGAQADMEPVRLVFPSRVLEEANKKEFLNDTLFLTSDFFGDYSVGEGFRMVYDTDNKGRILTQSLIDSKDTPVWVINNTWSGDRIIATRRTEGEDEKTTEYEYDSAGNRLVQRDIRNGLMERVVYAEGDNETEELYLDGVLIMKAYWENGRKISEERVRRR